MRWMKYLVLLCLAAVCSAHAESGTILKVLPCFLDQKGRHALKPSLYERDAYQALLRKNPKLRSGVRFDIQWKGHGLTAPKLRVEARGSLGGQAQPIVLEAPAKKGFLGNWTALTLDGDAYKKFGELTAWRATLWSNGRQVAEQKSYLW